MTKLEILKRALNSTKGLPDYILDPKNEVVSLDLRSFDYSYIEFLTEQIELKPRGDEWNEILLKRRSNLESFANITLLDVHLKTAKGDVWLKVQPEQFQIVHYELN